MLQGAPAVSWAPGRAPSSAARAGGTAQLQGGEGAASLEAQPWLSELTQGWVTLLCPGNLELPTEAPAELARLCVSGHRRADMAE